MKRTVVAVRYHLHVLDQFLMVILKIMVKKGKKLLILRILYRSKLMAKSETSAREMPNCLSEKNKLTLILTRSKIIKFGALESMTRMAFARVYMKYQK